MHGVGQMLVSWELQGTDDIILVEVQSNLNLYPPICLQLFYGIFCNLN